MTVSMVLDQGTHARVKYLRFVRILRIHWTRVFRTHEIIIDFSKAFNLVPHDRLLTKIAAAGVDLRVVVCVKEFLLGRSQRVKSRRATI